MVPGCLLGNYITGGQGVVDLCGVAFFSGDDQ